MQRWPAPSRTACPSSRFWSVAMPRRKSNRSKSIRWAGSKARRSLSPAAPVSSGAIWWSSWSFMRERMCAPWCTIGGRLPISAALTLNSSRKTSSMKRRWKRRWLVVTMSSTWPSWEMLRPVSRRRNPSLGRPGNVVSSILCRRAASLSTALPSRKI